MTHAWELSNPWRGIPLVGELIDAIQADLHGRSSGTAVLTFPGGTSTTNAVSINHGLSGTPSAVVAVEVTSDPGVTSLCAIKAGSYDPTTFVAQAQVIDGNVQAGALTVTIAWMAQL